MQEIFGIAKSGRQPVVHSFGMCSTTLMRHEKGSLLALADEVTDINLDRYDFL